MIKFDFKYDAIMSYSSMHEKYDSILSTPGMQGKWLLNYLSSHDDGAPFDPKREKTFESANRLLLNRGAAQIYYGEETARSLTVKAEGDAVLRSYMNWEDLNKAETQDLYKHFQKLGTFRQKHPAVARDGKNTGRSRRQCAQDQRTVRPAPRPHRTSDLAQAANQPLSA